METIKWICSNSGNVSAVFCHTNPEPSLVYNREGVETERAVPKGVISYGKETVQLTNIVPSTMAMKIVVR